MSYISRADNFIPRVGYDYTPPGPEDFIFNHNTTTSSPPTEDNLSTISSPSEHFEDIRPTLSFNNNKNYIFSTKYEKFHVIPHHRAGYNKIYNFRRSKSFFFELVDHLPDTNHLQLKIYNNDYHMSSTPINHSSTSQLPNFKFQISKQLTHFFSTQKVIPRRLQNKFFMFIRKKLLERADFIISRAQKKEKNNHMTKTFFNFSYKKYRFYFGIYLPCNHCHIVDPLSSTAIACLIPVPFTMSLHRHACVIHHKQLTLYFTSKDNKIPDISSKNSFKDFHATRLYNQWAKKRFRNHFSNRLGISFNTKYCAFNTNVVAKKGLDFIYGKVYQDFSRTPSSSPKVRKRQEKRFDALIRHTFHNADLHADAPMEDKLRAARHHVLLFQENQSITKPIKHLRYKKKFVTPLQGYYTFLIPFSETKRTSLVVPSNLPHDDSSVSSPPMVDLAPPIIVDIYENMPAHYVPLIPDSPLYDGPMKKDWWGLHNQPFRSRIKRHKLRPLTVGSEAWLAHMEEIYNIHLENLQYDLDKKSQWETSDEKAAISQWETSDIKGTYRRDLCDIIMEYTTAYHNYELKLREVSAKALIVLEPLVRPSNREYRNREKYLLQKLKNEEEDKEILAELLNRVEHLDHAIYCEYNRIEVGLKFYPYAVMDDRILKRRAIENGNLDSHYGLHKEKKVCIISTSWDLENRSMDYSI
ncbi:hypothetical protein RhiirA5_424789 [Rhizophagus irregularis]|uniref:DUF8211 domain-containing protein n=1 Tax=Rhizophagus irregularis TaxID=588596 RepID=A0A2N0P7C5_9GLOM|nr:hypothetical protein RhiirA5_424789 [Rhizophagus irregularis]